MPSNQVPPAVIAVPVIAAFILSAAMFKRRVGGVYFAIITQAVALILTVLIIGQQGYTGGVNGITDLKTMLGWDIRTDSAKYILYFVCCFALLGSMLLARQVIASKLGRILIAVRDTAHLEVALRNLRRTQHVIKAERSGAANNS